MVLLQDFSINGLEESVQHSPLRESMFIKGEGVERSLIGKRGGRGGPDHKKGKAKIDIILWNS